MITVGLIFRLLALALLFSSLFYPKVTVLEHDRSIIVGPNDEDFALLRLLNDPQVKVHRRVASEVELLQETTGRPILSALNFNELNPFTAFGVNHTFIRTNSCPSKPRVIDVTYSGFVGVDEEAKFLFQLSCGPNPQHLNIESNSETKTLPVGEEKVVVFSLRVAEGDNCFTYSIPGQRGEVCTIGIRSGDTVVVGSENDYRLLTGSWQGIRRIERIAELNDNWNNIKRLVVINQPITALEGYISELETFLRNGGELILFGGDRSFDNGGYKGSRVERLLPVSSDDKPEKVLRGSMAVAVLVDKSGSMRIDNRMEKVRFALKSLIQSMREEDYLTVIGFDTSAFQIFPLTKIQGSRDEMVRKVDALRAWGGTDPVQAMILAKAGLENLNNVAVKHIIILTDGEFKGDPGAILTMGDLIQQSKISISGVLVGDERNMVLERLTRRSGGQLYHSRDGSSVPQIFIGDVYRRLPPKMQTKEYSITFVKTDWRNRLGSAPPLKEVNKVKLSEGATVIASSQYDEIPLIAERKIGAGLVRTVAFSPFPAVNRQFSSWRKFNEFVSAVINMEESPTFTVQIKKFGKYFIITRVNSFEALSNDVIDYNPELMQVTRIPIDSDYEAVAVAFRRPGSSIVKFSGKTVAKLVVHESEFARPHDVWQNETLLNELVKLKGVKVISLFKDNPIKFESPNLALLFIAAVLWVFGAFCQRRAL